MKDIRVLNNIIKDDLGTIDVNEYNQNKLNNKINSYSNEMNELNRKHKESNEFLNLSLNDVFTNFTKTLILILNDIVLFIDDYITQNKPKEDMLINFFKIFIIEDRLIYVGLFFIMLSMFIYFMDVSS